MPMGIPAALLISSAIAGGSSVAGAALSNRKKESTSTSTPTLSPELQQVFDKLLADAGGMATDPMKGLAPLKTNAMEQVNRNYAGSADRISTSLAKRGYSGSGKAPGAFVNLETSRLSDQSGIESAFAKMGADRQIQGMGMTGDLLSRMTGQTSTGTMPGNVAGSALSAGGSSLGSLSALMILSQMLKGGGGSNPLVGMA
jgi:hypothetical protein